MLLPERYEKISYPAIRESVLNAIIHRNYHHLAPTKVSIYETFFQSSKPFIGRRDAVLKTANASLDNLNNQVSQFNKKNGGGLTVSAIPSRLGAYIQWPEDQMTQFRANYPENMLLQ